MADTAQKRDGFVGLEATLYRRTNNQQMRVEEVVMVEDVYLHDHIIWRVIYKEMRGWCRVKADTLVYLLPKDITSILFSN